MFRHVALFTWRPETTEEAKQTLIRELRALPGVIEGIRAYHVGRDAGVNSGNHDLAVVADFDDRAAYERYRDHPAHRGVVERHLAPIVAGRAAVQFEM